MRKHFIAHYVTEFLSHMGKTLRTCQTQTGAFVGVQQIPYREVAPGFVLGQLRS